MHGLHHMSVFLLVGRRYFQTFLHERSWLERQYQRCRRQWSLLLIISSLILFKTLLSIFLCHIFMWRMEFITGFYQKMVQLELYTKEVQMIFLFFTIENIGFIRTKINVFSDFCIVMIWKQDRIVTVQVNVSLGFSFIEVVDDESCFIILQSWNEFSAL